MLVAASTLVCALWGAMPQSDVEQDVRQDAVQLVEKVLRERPSEESWLAAECVRVLDASENGEIVYANTDTRISRLVKHYPQEGRVRDVVLGLDGMPIQMAIWNERSRTVALVSLRDGVPIGGVRVLSWDQVDPNGPDPRSAADERILSYLEVFRKAVLDGGTLVNRTLQGGYQVEFVFPNFQQYRGAVPEYCVGFGVPANFADVGGRVVMQLEAAEGGQDRVQDRTGLVYQLSIRFLDGEGRWLAAYGFFGCGYDGLPVRTFSSCVLERDSGRLDIETKAYSRWQGAAFDDLWNGLPSWDGLDVVDERASSPGHAGHAIRQVGEDE